MQSINPFNFQVLQEYTSHHDSEIMMIAAKCHQAFLTWKKLKVEQRAKKMNDFADALRKRKEEAARMISLEMGKPITESLAEIEKCIVSCEQLADRGPAWIADESETFNDSTITKRYEPLGVILLIMPWNFPFWQAIRCAVPAMLAGNAILLKHAPNVSGCSLLIEKIFYEAGFPEELFASVLIENERAHLLLELPQVRGVSLTGSEKAGATVASIAGQKLLKTVLELGGSDPFIILPDSDLTTICARAAKARLQNAGQSCIAAKRFLIPEKSIEEFTELLKKEILRYNFGDPLNSTTSLGPLARKDLQTQLKMQVEQAKSEGSHYETLLAAPNEGAFAEIGMLIHQPAHSTGRVQELFGPVFSILTYQNIEELIQLANETHYGLGASIWGDTEKGKIIASELECGNVFLNDIVKSDVRWPFGGQKNSGHGKELGKEGTREFCVQKILYQKK